VPSGGLVAVEGHHFWQKTYNSKAFDVGNKDGMLSKSVGDDIIHERLIYNEDCLACLLEELLGRKLGAEGEATHPPNIA